MRNVLVIIGFCFALTGCEPGDVIKVPVNDPRLVILANPENDQPWIVFVSHTEPLMSSVFYARNVPDATAKIYEDDQFVEQLIFNPNVVDSSTTSFTLNPYEGKTKPAAGHTYKIVVEAPGYETASATYVQPQPVSFEGVDLQITGASTTKPAPDFIYIAKQVEIAVTFTDPPGDNYYWFDLSGVNTTDTLANYYLSAYMISTDPAYGSDETLHGQLITDQNFKDQRVTLKFKTSIYTNIYPNDTIAANRFQFSVRNVTKELYDYRYSTTRPGTFRYDPYVQPTTVRSNINNGLGVFSGFTSSKMEFDYNPY